MSTREQITIAKHKVALIVVTALAAMLPMLYNYL
jgi:hypothetical protein